MVIYNRAEVAKRLRDRRKELGITAEDLAKHIGKAGCYYRDIERGQCGMSIETLVSLSSFLELSIDYIIFGRKQHMDGLKLSPLSQASFLLERCDEQTRSNAVILLKTYLELSEH